MLRAFVASLFRISLPSLTPGHYMPHFSTIRAEWLKQKGIHGLALDLDGTLIGWWDTQFGRPFEPDEELISWVEEMQEAGIGLCIVSNVPESFRSGVERVQRVAQYLGIDWVRADKPNPAGLIEAAQKIGLSVSEMAVVGDQLGKDILMAHLGKAGLSILVKPLTFWEFPGTMLIRCTKEAFLAWLINTKKIAALPPP